MDSAIVLCCCLHNMLRDEYIFKNPSQPVVSQNVEDFPTQNMIPLAGNSGYTKSDGFQVRSRFTDYFSTQDLTVHEDLRLTYNQIHTDK